MHSYSNFFRCAPGWDGRQCQHTYNPKLYESAQVAPEVENANVGSLITVILVGLIIFSGLVYLSKTFCKAHDLRDYMYSESSIDPTTMTPVQMYPFSQRSSSSPSTSEHLPTPISSYTVCHQQQLRQEQEKEEYQQQISQITLNSYNHFPYP
uniref:EGF-like domain-containing protein n=1 Tax=Panagrolaimus davidi TaxID=227884 RepID=A0A914PH01_9BILA